MGPWSFVEPRVRQQLGIQVGGRAVGERWVAEGDTLSCGSHPLYTLHQSVKRVHCCHTDEVCREESERPACCGRG